MRRINRYVIGGSIVLGACSGDESTGMQTPPPPRRGIQVINGANVTDSAGAALAQSLIVEVRDSTGALAPLGTVVRFTALRHLQSTDVEAYVQSLTSSQFDILATGTTDATGRTGVFVRLGIVAGPARIAISAPTLGVADTARYTIVPGAGVSFYVTPGDTALYVGRSYTLRGSVVDRYGNTRSDPVTWTVSGPGASVTSAGVVAAVSIGRYMITGSALNRSVGVWISVIPQARVAGSLGTHIIAIDLDGSNQRELAPVTFAGHSAHPAWIPGTNSIVYTHFDGIIQALYTVDENSTIRRFLSSPPPQLSHQVEPTPSANGQWLYFSAYDTRCSADFYCLYRSRMDGSAAEVLGNMIDSANVTWRPAPSPDGSKVAYVTSDGGSVIRVFDVATKTVSSWKVPGQNPRWSPTGAQIVFIPNGGGPLMLMNPDGSGVRALTQHSFVEQPLSWSADGRFIIVRSDGGLELIDALSGDVLPVRHLGGLAAPSFK